MSFDKIDFINEKERILAFLIKIIKANPASFPKTLELLESGGSARQFLQEVKLLSLDDDNDTDIEKPIIFFINFFREFSQSFDVMRKYFATLDEGFKKGVKNLLDELILILVFLYAGEKEELLNEINKKTNLQAKDFDDILLERLDTLETEIFSLLNYLYGLRK